MNNKTVTAHSGEAGELDTLIKEVTGTIAGLLHIELSRALGSERLGGRVAEARPYLIAAGVLALMGMDIHRDYIARLVSLTGTKPENEILNVIDSLKYRNHVVYIAAIFFFMANGIEVTPERLLKLVSAVDMHPELLTATETIELFKRVNAASSGP